MFLRTAKISLNSAWPEITIKDRLLKLYLIIPGCPIDEFKSVYLFL